MFDSGVGGLTVARAVIDLLPHEHLIYLGDTARGPFGPLPQPTVRRYAFEIIGDLAAMDVKCKPEIPTMPNKHAPITARIHSISRWLMTNSVAPEPITLTNRESSTVGQS